jgi:hypothetical protein
MPVSPALATLRENLVCIGWGKQSAWGTAVAATNWWRYLDGTEANPESNITSDREGDTSPYKSFVMKSSELGMIKIVERARPRTMGCALQALLGASSDTYVPATYSSTLAGNVVAGATTIKLTADPGNVGTLVVIVGIDTSTPEVLTLDLTSRTTPNYTVTIAASGTAQYAHTSADPVQSKAQHTFARGLTVYEPYTIECQYGTNGTNPFGVEQFLDAVCTEVQIQSQKGGPLILSHTWYSAKFQRKSSFSSVSYEGTGVVGIPGAPFIHTQAQNLWQVDGATINGRLESFQVTLKNSTDPHDLQTDGLNPAYFTPELFDVDGSAQVLFTTWDQYFKTYYGNTTSPTSTAVDSYLIGTGSIQTTWQADLVNSFNFNLSSMNYMAAKKAPPKTTSAKAMRQALSFSALRTPAAATPVTMVLCNTQNSQY